jgi:two-component system cell cycle sensor histidine kinase/response regulator CckA
MKDLPVGKQKILPERESTSRWWWTLFNATEDAQILCRADGAAQHINPKAIRLFKLKSDSNEGEFSIFKILPLPANQKLERLLKSRAPRVETIYSVAIVLEDAPSYLMDLETIPLEDGLTLVTFKDATRRLRLESHVQRLITAIDATPEVFLVTDADLRITYVNPAFQSATGYGIEEVLGRSDEFLRAPSEQQKIRAYLDHVSQGKEWIGEFINVRRNGEIYLVESTVSPISDIAGRFMGYVVCEREITMRKQLEDALRVERDFVQSILQSLEGAIYSLDCEFRLTHANDGWRRLPAEHGGIRLNGVPEIGRSLLDYVPDAARKAELQIMFKEVINSGKAQANYFHAADGHYWVIKTSPWVAAARVRGLICSVEDQTHNHELQNQLFQSQKMEIIGTLAAGVAHDFNNLLQVIIGHTGLILAQTETGASPLRQGLEKINMAAVRATEITQQLLSFSRATDEKLVVLDLNKIIKEAGQLARCSLRRNVMIEIQPTPEPIPVKMDSTRASQALLNLCVNSQDAMPDGGRLSLTNTIVKLPADLAARYHLEPGEPYARCSIADTGCGISPNLLTRIFQPFFTTKETGKGTGLGLPIVQRVAQEAGGFIEVESALGEGATFHLYLPLAREEITPATGPRQTSLAQSKGRVLVVDDVDLVRDFARKFLEMAGLTVLVANGGQEALQILERATEPPDILFTDYNMPGMNGVELMEQVAARWPKIKLILASGYLDETTHDCVERCHASLLSKPYSIHDAMKIILQKLTAKSAA